jgi:DNA-directed RNA polymerase specialized sigma24 family protein
MKEKPVGQNVKSANLLPLTKRDAMGMLYVREPEVDIQIIEILQLEKTELIKRLAISDVSAANYVKEECLVYLIRHFKREGIQDFESEVVNQLVKRIAKFIDRKIRKTLDLDSRYHKEASQDVNQEVLCRLIDIKTDKQDYAQYRFWKWLERIVIKTLAPHFMLQAQDKNTDSLEQVKEASADEIADRGFDPYKEMLIEEALSTLQQNEKIVFKLRYYAEWEIENQDSNVMTISKYMKKTPRTIYNLLQSAEAKLSKWRGGVK